MAKTSSPPGFRFHPTDVELIMFYLRRKVMRKQIPLDVISEIDIYEFSPWDLPEKSCLRSKDLEWYFLCPTERKYPNGSSRNRTTKDRNGYWKTTGADKPVLYNEQAVGAKKTLIFHTGKAPNGKRTDWVMHEYRLKDKALVDAGIVQDAYVICKIFHKSGLGAKNGAQYGAPFNEEEWSDSDFTGPPSTLPNNPSSSALTSTLISATICIGSSSETPLETVPCPDNMHPKYDASMPDIALSPDILSSPLAGLIADTTGLIADTTGLIADTTGLIADTTGLIADTTGLIADTTGLIADTTGLIADTTVQYNHEQNEILDDDNDNMFDDFGEENEIWPGLLGNRFIYSEVDYSNNQMFPCEDGVTLEDLAHPLDDPSNMKECNPSSAGPSHFSFYNSSKQPSYPFNYSDEHAPSTSQAQSSGSYLYGNDVLDNGVKEDAKQMYQEDAFLETIMEWEWELSNE